MMSSLFDLLNEDEQKSCSPYEGEDARAILSYLENHVVSITFDNNHPGGVVFNLGEEGTTIGDLIFNILTGK